jgi:predicted nucleic acid-binding Zn ribbon protein
MQPMTLPELAKLSVTAGIVISHNDVQCPPNTHCTVCPLNILNDTSACVYHSKPYSTYTYRRDTLIPYLHLHHPEAFL